MGKPNIGGHVSSSLGLGLISKNCNSGRMDGDGGSLFVGRLSKPCSWLGDDGGGPTKGVSFDDADDSAGERGWFSDIGNDNGDGDVEVKWEQFNEEVGGNDTPMNKYRRQPSPPIPLKVKPRHQCHCGWSYSGLKILEQRTSRRPPPRKVELRVRVLDNRVGATKAAVNGTTPRRVRLESGRYKL